MGNEAIKCCFKGKLTVLSVYIIKSSPQIITLKRLFKETKDRANWELHQHHGICNEMSSLSLFFNLQPERHSQFNKGTSANTPGHTSAMGAPINLTTPDMAEES